jgi:hypothetical protein
MTFRPKLWLTLGAALALTAACSEQGEAGGEGASGEGGSAVAGEGEGGEGEGGEGAAAGGAGEAGAQAAYAGVPAESLAALRIAHLKGFFLVAQQARGAEGDVAAAALAGQGMAEVYDAQAADFAGSGLDEAVLRRAAETGSQADLAAAVAALDAAQQRAGGNPGAVVAGLASIAAGIYNEVNIDGAVDPVEYQHALGSALAAQSTANAGNLSSAIRSDVDGLVALWRGVTAPEDASALTPAGQVQAQASRIQLAAG